MQGLELFGYLGGLLTLTTFSMKTMLHLRMVGIAANLAFISYGALGSVYPVLVLHVTLLPLNIWRLHQLRRLVRDIRDAATADFSVDWLKPFTRQLAVRAGHTLFSQGEVADNVLFVLSGRFHAVEADVSLGKGEVFGELGLIAKDQRRTQTVVCEEAGVLLLISYDEVRQLYFQNPKFGFYFLQLASERLMRDARQAALTTTARSTSAQDQDRCMSPKATP